jgi:hypothetical protein
LRVDEDGLSAQIERDFKHEQPDATSFELIHALNGWSRPSDLCSPY